MPPVQRRPCFQYTVTLQAEYFFVGLISVEQVDAIAKGTPTDSSKTCFGHVIGKHFMLIKPSLINLLLDVLVKNTVQTHVTRLT